MTHEHLRRSYKPKQVQLLFVGESPPASGRFFYAGDSGLYRAMLQVFECVDPGISNETFLEAFQASGCYLVDLCPTPVDCLIPTRRRTARAANEESLARTIKRLRPRVIVITLRSIEGNVAKAIAQANWKGPTIHLPYPGRWTHLRGQFVDGLSPVIAELFPRGVISAQRLK